MFNSKKKDRGEPWPYGRDVMSKVWGPPDVLWIPSQTVAFIVSLSLTTLLYYILQNFKTLLLHFSTKVCPEAIQIPNPALCYNLTQHKTKGFSSILKDWSPYFIWLPVAVLDYGQCFTNIGPTQTDWWRLTRMKPVLIYCRTIREVFTHCVSYIKWSDES